MTMKQSIITLIVLIIILAIVWGLTAAFHLPGTPSVSNEPVSNAEDMAVRAVVTAFGNKMQQVSLLASTSARTAAMNVAYSPYVAPELLAKWYPEGAEAFGRYTSSPWPERINVQEVQIQGNRAVVEGVVIEVTSTEVNTGTAAATYPITLTLEKRNGNWMIIDATKGAYSEIPHRQTIVGIWECLPPKDPSLPHTMECAFGIAADQSDGHYAVNTMLMSQYPVDFPTGTKVRVSGVVVPANQLSSVQKYDIDGVINATEITKAE
jgi:hypothetical protein